MQSSTKGRSQVHTELTRPSPLLDAHGQLAQVGWSRQPLLDCNLEQLHRGPLGLLRRLRIKRWDYYALFTPQRFFSTTIADLGYAGNIFVYTLDFTSGALHEEGVVIPLGRGITLERNSTEGVASFTSPKLSVRFEASPHERWVRVNWPGFHGGRGIAADVRLRCAPAHESMNIVIPMGRGQFYANTKINCLPAEGWLRYGDVHEELRPEHSLGALDWGRGVWPYRSFWNWASASGFLPGGGTIGLNLGCGFGDLRQATENAVIVNGRIHKLGAVQFAYRPEALMQPWRFVDDADRLELTFTPFTQRTARTNLGLIFSEVHQLFGRYNGRALLDDGNSLEIRDLIGFAEEHRARW